MKRDPSLMALCSAVAIAAGDGVPDWIHLLPAGAIRTVDGRGPYSVDSMQALAEASLSAGQKLPLDENHSTDKAAPLGKPSPARGWIVELQAREDGLWARVDWTGKGKALMEDRAYGGVSPAVRITAGGKILKVLRASLTNTPNLEGLVALHSEEDPMDWKAKLIGLLGLDSNADDAAIEAALKAKMTAVSTQSVDLLQHPAVIALQTQLTDAATKITALTEGNARKEATAFVDAAIVIGRVGVKPLREEYIELHMADPAKAAKMIGAQPILTGETITAEAPADGQRALNADDRLVMETFGVSEEDYRAGLKASGQQKENL